MDRKTFSEVMTKFQALYDTNEMTLDRVYDAIGCDFVELLCSTSYLSFVIEIISKEFTNDVREDLEYLIYECGFNLDVYSERVLVDGKRIALSTFEDYYDYLKGEDFFYADN